MLDVRADRDRRLSRLADEQAALRRVATLVARGVSPDQLFSFVSDEVGRLFGAEATVARFEPDGSAAVVVGQTTGIPLVSVGSRWELDDLLATSAVYRRGQPARNDRTGLETASGPVAERLRTLNLASTVAAPIVVEGKLWGVIAISHTSRRLPSDTEERVGEFAELVGSAISNAESRAALGRMAEEQAALRRVATLVARGLSPGEIFNAVSNEVSRALGCEQVVLERFDADVSAVLIVGTSAGSWITSVGDRWPLEEFLGTTAAYRTGRPGRANLAAVSTATGPVADRIRQIGFISTVAAPIVVEGRAWGAITVADTQKDLPQDTEARVEHFTELVATAIANAQSRAELATSNQRAQELAREQAALRRVATLVAEGADAAGIFAAVVHEVADLCSIPVVGVHRFEPDATFTTLGVAGETLFTFGSRWPIEDGGVAAAILATGRPARKEDYSTMTGPLGEAVRNDRLVATVGLPIVVDGTIWGFIVAAARPGKHIPHGTEERLARFTELVATAIANSQAREQLAQLAEQQAALRRVATTVARGAPPDQVFRQVAEEVGRLLGVELTGIYRFEPDGYATIVTNWGEMGEVVPAGRRVKLDGDSVTAKVSRTARPARIESYDGGAGPIAADMRTIGMRSGVGSPIVVNGRTWGAIAAATSRADPLRSDAEERIAEFTGLVATAIANVEARTEVQRLADEQAALRRVATLVARGVSPDEIFSAVSNEVARLFGSQQAAVGRFDADGHSVVISGANDGSRDISVGTQRALGDDLAAAAVYRSGDPARLDETRPDDAATNPLAEHVLATRVVSRVAAPIVVEGKLWGVITVAHECEPLPRDTEDRLAKFTELVGTAIANAESRRELAASRTRIIAAADEARRRIERDLHDGAQQRLVTLAVALRRAEAKIPSRLDELRADVSRVAEGLTTAVEELREMSRGIHPSVLTEGGLSPALKALARRSAVRVKLDLRCDDRLADQIEVAAYYTVSEALTNASKHAAATRVWVTLYVQQDALHLSIRDDGVGGADPSRGSGLIGLRDRIEALGGTIQVESSPDEGTRIEATIPWR